MLGQTRNISSWKTTAAAAAAARARSAAPQGAILPGRAHELSPGPTARPAHHPPVEKQRYAALRGAQGAEPAPLSTQATGKVSRARGLFLSLIKRLPQQDFHGRLIRKYAELLPGFDAKLY